MVYEQQVTRLLSAMEPAARDVQVTHQELVHGLDGSYAIDCTIRFTLFEIEFLVLVECKLYQARVKREDLQILHTKLQSTGAQKGLVVTSTGYQRGAIEFGQKHRIALAVWTGDGLHFPIGEAAPLPGFSQPSRGGNTSRPPSVRARGSHRESEPHWASRIHCDLAA